MMRTVNKFVNYKSHVHKAKNWGDFGSFMMFINHNMLEIEKY